MSHIKEINNFTVEAIVEEYNVKFEILDECSNNCGNGYVKWDGCSNWNLDLHFCNKAHPVHFGNMLSELYTWAAELLPQYAEDINYTE